MDRLKLKKSFLLTLTIISIIGAGFLRDFLFKFINGQLYIVYYYQTQTPVPPPLSFLLQLNYSQLYYLKWFLTFLFTGIYFLLSCITLHLLFNNKNYFKVCFVIYLFVFILSFLFMSIGYLIKDYSNMYYLARQFMGFLQSPFILMMLIPALKLYERQKDNI